MPRCSVCDDGAALLCGACVDAELAASRARLAQARRAEADWRAQAEAAPARPPASAACGMECGRQGME